ncbi:MAG: response regulator, partial [Bdellovibrionota bacterium]
MKRNSILIVDDESYIREFLAQVLSEHFKVRFAKNSEEAVSEVNTTQPDLILLDVLMPGVNGIETCKLIRMQPESKNIPVIMLTALGDIEQKVKAFQAGADDYLAKPFLPEELIARILRKLESKSDQKISKSETQVQLGNLKLKLDSLSL